MSGRTQHRIWPLIPIAASEIWARIRRKPFPLSRKIFTAFFFFHSFPECDNNFIRIRAWEKAEVEQKKCRRSVEAQENCHRAFFIGARVPSSLWVRSKLEEKENWLLRESLEEKKEGKKENRWKAERGIKVAERKQRWQRICIKNGTWKRKELRREKKYLSSRIPVRIGNTKTCSL